MKNLKQQDLPEWTWYAPFLILPVSSLVSAVLQKYYGLHLFYLPVAFALILVNWWGIKRVVAALFLNACFNSFTFRIIYGIEVWQEYSLSTVLEIVAFALPETTAVILSWLLFTCFLSGRYWLPDIRAVSTFLIFGIAVPVLVRYLLGAMLATTYGYQQYATLEHILLSWHGDSMFYLVVCTPVLYLGSKVVASFGLVRNRPRQMPPLSNQKSLNSLAKRAEFLAIMAVMLAMSFFVPFEQFWFAYGLLSLLVAIRFGFGLVLYANLFQLLVTYILPSIFGKLMASSLNSNEPLYYVYLGNFMLAVFAMLAGRTISDLKSTEKSLKQKNQELQVTNEELDRFVYSASHDLVAPLKTIMGLVALAKISPESVYLDKIEKSTTKLHTFIGEIQDFTFNKRTVSVQEKVNLKELCQEVVSCQRQQWAAQDTRVILKISEPCITVDYTRLKIILSNLLSNAFRFRKTCSGSLSKVIVSARTEDGMLCLKVLDTGQGIKPEIQGKVFNMFFRGTEASNGSGLGLYISREAAKKAGGSISVNSVYGQGSLFIVNLPAVAVAETVKSGPQSVSPLG